MAFRYLAASLLAVFLWVPVRAQDLQSSDPDERARGARELGKQGSEAIPALQKLLGDPDLDVRLEAVKSIVSIGTQHSLDALVQATRDSDPEIQIRATDGLVNFYLPGYVQTGLTASLKRVGTSIKGRFTDVNYQVIDPYIKVRPEIIEALGKLARGASSMEARANAARALGVLRGKAAVPDLLQAVRSKDTQVIYEVLVALQKIRDPEAAPGIAFLLRDLDEKVQVAALETTGLLQNKEALPRLYDALRDAKSKKVKRAALTAIAMLPDEKSRPVYQRYIHDKDDASRAAAAEGFARLENASDLPMLEKLFQEEKKMNPRLSLAFALVKLGKTEVSEFSPLQYLINTLNSSSWRGIARPFLIELSRTPTVRQALYQALPQATKDEKIGIAQVLARSGKKDSIAHLEPLTNDSDPEVVQEALRAVRTLKARFP
jgi:HEAT repeat protein